MAVITVGISLLMVSTIRYDTLPKPSKRAFMKSPVKFIVLLLGLVASIVTKGVAIFPFMALYLIYGMIRHAVTAYREREIEDDDTMEEEEPTPFDI